MNEGWVKLFRSLQDNQLYFSEKFSRTQAWIDLILLAEYKERDIMVRGINVRVPRGTVACPIDTLQKRWKWSKNKVLRFLKWLEDGHYVELQKSNVINLVSIVNYATYQDGGTANETTNETTNGTTETKEKEVPPSTPLIEKEKYKKEKEESLSPRMRTGAHAGERERERLPFEEFLFFERKIDNPSAEAARFADHYARTGWKDANGIDIVDPLAALRNWNTKGAANVAASAASLRAWRQFYDALPGDEARRTFINGIREIRVTAEAVTLTVAHRAAIDTIEDALTGSGQCREWFFNAFPGKNLNYELKDR